MRYGLLIILLLCSFSVWAQEATNKSKYVIDADIFYGSILRHNPSISHLITGHPTGFLLSVNRKTFGEKPWQEIYNYPDYGLTFAYQNMRNEVLGNNYSLYAHYNFYFFKRNLQFRIGQGLAYNTNPYDRGSNFRNTAYGSHILSSTMAMVNYQKENVLNGLGFKLGFSVIHYSNANFKAPNTSTNTFAFNVGLNYDLNSGYHPEFIVNDKVEVKQPIKFNLALRSGVNESDNIGSGVYGFWVLSAYADKRLGRMSAIQLGADYFYSNFLKELIRFRAISFPEDNVDLDTDHKRVGIFVGHELFVNKLSLITQLGYYVYYPFDFEGRVYNRIGLKRYFGEKWFASVTLKSHAAAAEAVEFGIGVRL